MPTSIEPSLAAAPAVLSTTTTPMQEIDITPGLAPAALPSPTAPVAIPTTVPTAATRPTATALPTPTSPQLTATPPSSAASASRVADLEATLKSGTFEVAIEYGPGHRSSVIVQFDLGDPGGERRLALTTTSTGQAGEQRLELLAVGDRIWQRRPGEDWRPGVSLDGLWEQFQLFLPQIRGAQGLTIAQSGEVLVLHWADSARGAELELQIAASDGRPLLLREVIPADGIVMVVTYNGWNTPVAIAPPGP
jgi:hypothetical protein